MRAFDERDTIFSRVALCEGTPRYKEYYARRPELEDVDRQIREMPRKGMFRQMRPGSDSSSTGDRELAVQLIVKSSMELLDTLQEKGEKAQVSPRRIKIPLEEVTPFVKEVARHCGADLVGTIEMADHHFYTHHGERSPDHGLPVDRSLRYAIILAVETDRDMINRAPHVEEMLATIRGYRDVAYVGCGLTLYLKSLGYNAFLNTVRRYNAPLVPLARDAGLGQIGRHGMLITRQFGPRVRLGAVMTDLPLLSDRPVDFGLTDFCKRCGKCAKNCIGSAISAGGPGKRDGRPRWDFIDTNCMTIWRRVGTDCGVCLSTCPFSQGVDPETFDRIADGPKAIDQILADYEARHGDRPYIKDKLPIAQL